MRATAAGFIFNAPRLISAIAPLIAGTLIVGLGGYGKAATIIGLFYMGLRRTLLTRDEGKPLTGATLYRESPFTSASLIHRGGLIRTGISQDP
jgi:hypothetical protein